MFSRPKYFMIHYFSMHCAWFGNTFLRAFEFLAIKVWELNFWGKLILENVWIIWSSLLYFNFKSFLDPNSSWFITFQCILHDSGVRYSESRNFYNLKKGDLISGWNQFWRMSKLFAALFSISIFKLFQTQILRHSLNFSVFCMNQEYFSVSLAISTYQGGGT